jgi:peptidoglycan hydrolase-like protein with peptidoglycan-binding domain
MDGLNLLGADAHDARTAAAQRALRAAGFKGGDGKPLAADGVAGPNTRAAIKAFWASRGESRDPVVDDDLLAALDARPGDEPAPRPRPQPPQDTAPPGGADPAAKTSPLVYVGAALAALAVGGGVAYAVR